MKKLLLTILICNLFLTGVHIARAQTYSGVEGQIKDYLCAPADDGTSDLFGCINKIYRFSLVFASSIAVFFIVIAGYIYMSAEGNAESVDKAKNILASSITALVILFSGFVILKAINPDLIKFSEIRPSSVTGVTPGTSTSLVKTFSEQEARITASSNGITVNAQPPKTQLQGIREGMLNEIINLKKTCNCTVEITGGTEPGHASGACSHSNGYKLDLAMNTTLDKYIKDTFASAGKRSDGAALWKNNANGALYAEEASQGTGPHWDVALCQ